MRPFAHFNLHDACGLPVRCRLLRLVALHRAAGFFSNPGGYLSNSPYTLRTPYERPAAAERERYRRLAPGGTIVVKLANGEQLTLPAARKAGRR